MKCTDHKPVLWIAGGGPGVPTLYGYGYWTGPHDDLLCVLPNIKSRWRAEQLLSPFSRIKWLALTKFKIKHWAESDWCE